MATRGLCALVCGVLLATLSGAGCSGGGGDVTVPVKAAQTDLPEAFDILHGLGLRVEITQPTRVWSLGLPAVKLDPAAGSRVAKGSTVKVTPVFAGLGSPASSKSALPQAVVPNLVGQSLNDAVRWANQHGIYWSVPTLPALPASNAATLFDAYRVTGQRPAPGATIVQGIRLKHGFKPTPLALIAVTN